MLKLPEGGLLGNVSWGIFKGRWLPTYEEEDWEAQGPDYQTVAVTADLACDTHSVEGKIEMVWKKGV